MIPATRMSKLPPGVSYVADFVTRLEEEEIVSQLDTRVWSNTLKRRVQHFGFVYDYKARTVKPDAFLGELPAWLQFLAQRLMEKGLTSELSDQAIANEYMPGQGISAHVDCVPCFGETIVSLSLLSACVMNFRHKSHDQSLSLDLHPRSIVLLSGEGRYDWTHEIPARKSDVLNGFRVERSRRISLTFRKVIST